MTARQIRKIREALNETRWVFGARWLRSPRSVEDWEQGRRHPDKVILRDLLKLQADQRAAK